ncbi:hypothetical protein SFRURICE_020256 [Spodoptera frugiperda]|nr:hypothetical protein SFRURICE_020256 [Spodoptera frugiperda]
MSLSIINNGQVTQSFLFFFFQQITLPRCYDFLLCRGCVYQHISSHTHYTQQPKRHLWITQRVTPCENRSRYTLRSKRLPSYCANPAVYSPK